MTATESVIGDKRDDATAEMSKKQSLDSQRPCRGGLWAYGGLPSPRYQRRNAPAVVQGETWIPLHVLKTQRELDT